MCSKAEVLSLEALRRLSPIYPSVFFTIVKRPDVFCVQIGWASLSTACFKRIKLWHAFCFHLTKQNDHKPCNDIL